MASLILTFSFISFACAMVYSKHFIGEDNYSNKCIIKDGKCHFTIKDVDNKLTFFIPVMAANASGSLRKFCNVSDKMTCALPLFFNGSQKIYIKHENTIVRTLNAHYTHGQFECFGPDTWDRRLCRFANLSFAHDKFFFFPPYDIKWASPIMIASCRALPIAPWEGSVYMNNYKGPPYENLSYRPGKYMYNHPGYLTYSLWHGMIEQTIPLWQTWYTYMNRDPDTVWLVKRGLLQSVRYSDIAMFMSPAEVLEEWATYEEVFMGMTKVIDTKWHIPKEREKNPPKYQLEWFNFENITDWKVLKQLFWKRYNPPTFPQNKPLVLFIRRASKRKIVNQQEAYERLVKEFPQVNITLIEPEWYEYEEQMGLFEAADVVIAAHGMALCQVLWMKPGKSVIEIFPYGIEARDWYKYLSLLNGLHHQYYAPTFNRFEEENKKDKRLWECMQEEPLKYDCLDKTLFTDAWVDIDQLVVMTRKALIDAGVKL
ncbi:hypothetical protein TVAG_298350 [Trichomonas vaginalis G3]|uniref:Glycosyltransferase 61 catalytic domain-containing protein n=1 Tax=Trichomonas vaginalis (strain ATCC PRA-98 / G3) TaxID=412133 RepID=A2ET26_TRIV3|nr:protein of unknown function, DUF563 family [Trichomonas vaginalis G3]EAY04215.1 hypothetical protein TVAG_298350 [Trichomonas vaginalis G3]KAI5493089.1 protein of unknown function, DUF563 family [Trichomonas vaginalis G3]|eukprot:XP_001316438.1 hypothetical protein [Trichomonas vaginalis G3]